MISNRPGAQRRDIATSDLMKIHEEARVSAAAEQQATAKLTIGDTTAEFPLVRGTAGTDSIDFSTLTRQTGYTGLDYGFVNTASTKSAITFIDGDKGILRYRGYPIEQLAGSTSYLEVAWLLIYGELPSAAELAEFDEKIRRHTLLHEDLKRFFSALPHTCLLYTSPSPRD